MKDEENILKWLDNELSSDEIKDLKQSEGFTVIDKIAHYSSQMEAPKVNAEEALAAFRSKNSSKTKVIPINFKRLYKYAALLAIMLCVTYFSFFNNETSFNTNIAQTETIILPDNSKVILNAVSTLSYNKKEWKTNRNLDLDGEAYFKVNKGETFTVNTDAGKIQVLGTQFNVKERNNYFEVQCYEGLVAVTYNNKTIKLSKGKAFRVINGKEQLVEDINSLNPSWLQQESSFVKVPLKHVIEELENHYDIKIISKGIDTKKLFTGTFTYNNKDIALQAVTIPLKLSYKTEGSIITFYKYEK
ncbi:FecR family protein [Lacinutrix sp. Bg11-31]|uniref:FecR family protein n=1 Tax=Lacinutrix sp. Bg11-31 TaxID=2057808 RepID=UPI000C302D06|nr:FecR family protein [Lacinutrix sp. Bg11-31]AUC83369.1 anti-sigma factor [Lacinutrix sp. Bg11-31]